jgi:hypothetical protein
MALSDGYSDNPMFYVEHGRESQTSLADLSEGDVEKRLSTLVKS